MSMKLRIKKNKIKKKIAGKSRPSDVGGGGGGGSGGPVAACIYGKLLRRP